MNKPTSKTRQTESQPEPKSQKRKAKSKYVHPSPTRETVESLVVAFILAFLFRTFEAEAFVIPTGSMAETLNGRHKEVTCEQCGWYYHIGASQEVSGDSEYLIPRNRIHTSICPNCRFENEVYDLPVFHGDRILVNKFPYEIGDPRRWDVVVFKNPEEPMRNFIKRLVGLPDEYLRIDGGDVYARKSETDPWQILRKDDPYKQLELQMIVYDNDHPERLLLDHGWPERWAAVKHDRGRANSFLEPDPAGWAPGEKARSFSVTRDRSQNKHCWLRYRHLVPDEAAWEAISDGPQQPVKPAPAPKLISDFCGYNQVSSDEDPPRRYNTEGVYWVGDLTISMAVDVTEAGEGGELVLELTEGVRDYHCKVDLTSGNVTLDYFDHALDQQKVLGEVTTSLSAPGSYALSFANVDNRLCLWIDGELMPFPSQGNYEAPATSLPTPRDLAPVGVAVRDADVTVSNLKLTRDIYYRAEENLRVQRERFARERQRRNNFEFSSRAGRGELREALDDPELYGERYLTHDHSVEFPQLGGDEFFVLGDNSPASLDSRLWEDTNAVPRHAMLGKAFFIYWPHGVPFLNEGKGYPLTYHTRLEHRGGEQFGVKDKSYPKLRYPFYPNVGRMERIR